MPQRTCVGCRQRDDQENLLRTALADDGATVIVDEQRRRPGRGAWLHRDPQCMADAIKRRAFARSFRGQVEVHNVEAYFRNDRPT